MYAVGRLSSYISQGVYTVSAPFHPFGGAVDIIVVQQQDGSFKSSPWYVKFGKFQGVLKTREKIVNINVNGVEADFHMYLDHKGEAYFLKEVEGEEYDSTGLSPSSSGDETDDRPKIGRNGISKSCDYDMNQPNLDAQLDVGSGKIIARTNSRRSRIFGLMFGRKPMKEDSRQREGSEDAVSRSSSLDRAEIAADLLDMKWSTNLPTDRQGKNGVSRLASMNLLAEEADKVLQVNADGGGDRLLVYDIMDTTSDHSYLHNTNCPCHGEMGNSSSLTIGNTECSNGLDSLKDSCLRPEKLDKEVSTLEAGVLEEKVEEIPQNSVGINTYDIENADFDKEESTSVFTVPCVLTQHSSKLDGDALMQHGMEQAPDERVQVVSVGVPSEESEKLFMYSETSESSGVGCDVFDKQTLVTLDCSRGKCEEEQVDDKVLSEEVDSSPEWAAFVAKEDSNGVQLSNDEDSGKFPNAKSICRNDRYPFNADTKRIVTESHCSYGIHLLTSESGEARMLEIIHQETITERLTKNKHSDTKPVENRSQVMGFSHCPSGSSGECLEELSEAPGSHVEGVSVNQVFHSIEDCELRGVCISSRLSHSTSHVQEEEHVNEENEMNKLHHPHSFVGDSQGSSIDQIQTKTTISNISPPDSSGDDQFFFSDINDFGPSGAHYENSGFSNSVDTKNDPMDTMDGFQESQGSNDMNPKSYFSPVKHVQECSVNSFESPIAESRAASSPMSIPRSRKSDEGEVEWMIESLPNFRSHIDNLEMDDLVQPLSHSLDSHSENLKWGLLRKDASTSLRTDPDTEHQQTGEDLTAEDIQIWEELKNMSADSAVEISLCKHLLFEGMGTDAASQAFNAEKVDLEKFVSLGHGIVKNDKLIIRIGSHYFPWAAAAPIILGMVTFGQGQILEPKGMILVDQVEQTAEGEQSKATTPSGGSWKLWPFTFKRSNTIHSVQPTPDGTNDCASVNASESINTVTEDDPTCEVKVARKKVPSLVPTSEQLAMLNLKEGRNVITFTFSTAMLGKQQVDARIYLWKWNTRIVISDVDGTITKSDVLGQFMPLVGKDWSQTGVTHLFSAIKENGYQLLFLSARAISQAYLTRQFLFNLKQDGKALPDGPVVISPDGLFPSLFREVIRRAPHEFKIACLKVIKDLFPPDSNPFYAGFGNRDTDEFSYLKVGVPRGKIFIINAKGEVSVNRRVDRKSYTSLHSLVDDMFPAMASAEQEEFNSWNYWRTPIPNIDC